MPVYFAAARCPSVSPVARVLAKRVASEPANDEALAQAGSDATLREALLHFASSGLGAARLAHAAAEHAFAAGDEREGVRWRAICRMFDRRLASTLPSENGR